MHRGGRGKLSSFCRQWSPAGGALQHWEGAGRPVRGMDPQKHSVGCLHGASKFPGRNWFPLGFWLGDGRGRWRWQASLFPAKLSSVVRGSTALRPVVSSLSALQAKLLTYNLPDVKSHWLSELTESGPSAFCKPDSGVWPGLVGCCSTAPAPCCHWV